MYDFQVYGYLAKYIATAYFPKNSDPSSNVALIATFGAYSAAFLMRPLGGLWFGRVGDSATGGRRTALVQSTALMAIPSLLMGLLPTYTHWGIWSSIFLVIMRCLQGFALGGQLSGSYVLMVEAAPENRRGAYGALVSVASSVGAAIASGIVAVVAGLTTDAQMESWGWRLPFVFGGVFAPLGVGAALFFAPAETSPTRLPDPEDSPECSAKSAADSNDTPNDLSTVKAGSEREPHTGVEHTREPTTWEVLKREWRRLLLLIGSVAASACGFYFKVWLLTYVSALEDIASYHIAAAVSTVAVFAELPFFPIAGLGSDLIAEATHRDPHSVRSFFLVCGQVFLGVYAPILWWWLTAASSGGDTTLSSTTLLLSLLVWDLGLGFTSGNLATFEVEAWMDAPDCVYTGVALTHNFATVVFGGLVPTIATALYDAPWAPASAPFLYFSAVSCLSVVCHVLRGNQTKRRERAREPGLGVVAGVSGGKERNSAETTPLLTNGQKAS